MMWNQVESRSLAMRPAVHSALKRFRIDSGSLLAACGNVAVGAVLLLIAIPAHGQSPNSGVPGAEMFARAKTPIDLWEAVDYLIRAGRADEASSFLQRFIAAKPDDQTLLKIRDDFGLDSILRLADHPATRGSAELVMSQVKAAATKVERDPTRLARLIDQLNKSGEERALAEQALRRVGPRAVPPILTALITEQRSAAEKVKLVETLTRLDRTASGPLIAALDSENAEISNAARTALLALGDPAAKPFLAYATGQPEPVLPILFEAARAYSLGAVSFPAPMVELWTWDPGKPAENNPTPKVLNKTQASRILAWNLARKALSLEPRSQEVRLLALGLALEPGSPVPAEVAKTLVSSTTTEELSRLLRQALADGAFPLAVVVVDKLAPLVDRSQPTEPSFGVGALVAALDSPDRRVQFAAARALSQPPIDSPFPGRSRVTPTLERFARMESLPRAVVIDDSPNRGNYSASLLQELGYSTTVAPSNAEGFRIAVDTADVELIQLNFGLLTDPMPMATFPAPQREVEPNDKSSQANFIRFDGNNQARIAGALPKQSTADATTGQSLTAQTNSVVDSPRVYGDSLGDYFRLGPWQAGDRITAALNTRLGAGQMTGTDAVISITKEGSSQWKSSDNGTLEFVVEAPGAYMLHITASPTRVERQLYVLDLFVTNGRPQLPLADQLQLSRPAVWRDWPPVDTVANLRADSRTANIPIVIVAPLGARPMFRHWMKDYPRIAFVATAGSSALLAPQFKAALSHTQAQPLSVAERRELARQAVDLLKPTTAPKPSARRELDTPQTIVESGT